MNTSFYNAHHSPIGAFATLTLGSKGRLGGLGLELAGPANEDLFVGLEDADHPGRFSALPFFQEEDEGDGADYDVENLGDFSAPKAVFPFPDSAIERTFGASIDEWAAGDLTFRLITQVKGVPDPDTADDDSLKNAICPAIWAELSVDNSKGARPRKAFLGYRGSHPRTGMRLIEADGLVGIAQGNSTGIASLEDDVYAGIAFQPERILDPLSPENLNFLVGNLALLVGTVQPREVRTFRFAVAFFSEATATFGISTRYLYRRYFDSLESVLGHALGRFDVAQREGFALDKRLRSRLSEDRYWMLSQAIRSYFGSTQLLESEDGRVIWVVNEGEYRMMNTFDLVIDQSFFELALNPWTVRNVLDLYAERYSYRDQLRLPGSDQLYPGGIAFTHDMGVANVFSRPGYSGYEQSRLKGCFSYMSSEELMNWILTGALYDHFTKDLAWSISHKEMFMECFASLVARDNPDSSLRNGVVGLDSDHCAGGSEITTYDSLDSSLGQARNSLYLGVKAWACYVAFESLFRRQEEHAKADEARAQAERAINTIVAAADQEGFLPAVLGEGVQARIIPAIEGLVYPYVMGLPIDSRLKVALERHLQAVLKPGICLFDDGGWKLSSTSDNSWLSKIYLCQFVAERILSHEQYAKADSAHRAWLLNPENAYYAWSDQMLAGRAVGSRYYPRGVTAILWASSGDRPVKDVSDLLLESAFHLA